MNDNKTPTISYQTDSGFFYHGKAEDILNLPDILNKYIGQIDLLFTSPPFPLNRKKKYGNLLGQDYIDWLAAFAPIFVRYLKSDGSIVLEMGNSWEPGQPIMSTLALRALLAFLDNGNLNLCQQFVWNNPARLPSPAQWVNVERIRVKDAFTHLWWMSPSMRPKANNRNVLQNYSESMNKLLISKKYNAGIRPSEHNIGKTSFLKDNKGAIPSNVITIANTKSNSDYLNYCKTHKIQTHPARMPIELACFFINFLTNNDDLVLDPFAGSNTTGAAADKLGRRWLSIEPNEDYIEGSKGRFLPLFYKG